MSTLTEIQNAVAQLPHAERKALQIWLNSQANPEMSAEEEARLLRSLDEAIHDIDAGKGLTIDSNSALAAALRHSLRSPLKKYRPGHFSSLAKRNSR
jgi:hypothetical protein